VRDLYLISDSTFWACFKNEYVERSWIKNKSFLKHKLSEKVLDSRTLFNKQDQTSTISAFPKYNIFWKKMFLGKHEYSQRDH